MKVFVTGATGVLGSAAVLALLKDGHEVTGLARCDDKARALEAQGAAAVSTHLFDVDALTDALSGFDAVCNLVTHIPVGAAGLRPRAWRVNDRLRTEGSKAVATAAKSAGVRRFIQESVSAMYADGGESLLNETSPLCVTRVLEPSAVAETNAAEFANTTRQAVTLRFGTFIGDDPMTRWMLGRAKAGHAIGFGIPETWAHVVHPEDAGAAVAAALHAPGGVYNVGADPIRRGDIVQVFAEVANRPGVSLMPKLLLKLAGERVEPLTRSQRVNSVKLHDVTGWKPAYDVFDEAWLTESVAT